nr:MMPL family transporter [Streptomyces sp. RTd22]
MIPACDTARSSDYQVFLVSRMHEEWLHTKDNARSVRIGQVETARVIAAAAAIMVCVFVAFVFGGTAGRARADSGLGRPHPATGQGRNSPWMSARRCRAPRW